MGFIWQWEKAMRFHVYYLRLRTWSLAPLYLSWMGIKLEWCWFRTGSLGRLGLWAPFPLILLLTRELVEKGAKPLPFCVAHLKSTSYDLFLWKNVAIHLDSKIILILYYSFLVCIFYGLALSIPPILDIQFIIKFLSILSWKYCLNC